MDQTSTWDGARFVVVDANALIGAAAAGTLLTPDARDRAARGELRVVTVPECVAEIRDEASREAYARTTLAFDVIQRDPSDDSITAGEPDLPRERARRPPHSLADSLRLTSSSPRPLAVSAFARQTGDLGVLSDVDLKLIALARDCEREAHGVAHLATSPRPTAHVMRSGRRGIERMPGWDPDDRTEWIEEADASAPSRGNGEEGGTRITHTDGVDVSEATTQDLPSQREASRELPASEAPQDNAEDDDGGGWETARRSKNAQRKQRRKTQRREEVAAAAPSAHTAHPAVPPAEAPPSKEEGEGLTPSVPGAAGETETETGGLVSEVVSLTGDFAMQNVLMQIGLRVAGPGGKVIRELVRWGVRCHACGFATDNPAALGGTIFCPKCGNMNTLDRCQIVVQGGEVVYLQRRRPTSLRGTRYSLPMPKGGRDSTDPILREDAPGLSRRGRPKIVGNDVDAFAPEYNEETWFQVNRVNKKGEALRRQMQELQHKAKGNPNARKLTRTNRRR